MNKKRLLSLLTAVTITASAFTGLVIPASAETTTTKGTYIQKSVDDNGVTTWDFKAGGKTGATGEGVTSWEAGTNIEEQGLILQQDASTGNKASLDGKQFKTGGTGSKAEKSIKLTMPVKGTLKVTAASGGKITADGVTRDCILEIDGIADKQTLMSFSKADSETATPDKEGTSSEIDKNAVVYLYSGNSGINFKSIVLTPSAETPVVTDAPATDTPATDAPATDTPATDAPATDAPATDTPATDAPDITDAPTAPVSPAWSLGKTSDTDTSAAMAWKDYQGKENVLHIIERNAYTTVNDVSTGVVNFNTNVYLTPTGGRTFRIVLQNATGEVYNTDSAFAQVAVNGEDNKVYVGPALDNTGSGTALFTPSAAGWYNIDVTVDYDKKDTTDFITVVANSADGTKLGEQKIGAIAGKDTTLKAIRLVKTASEVYFADMKVTPASAVTAATPVPTKAPATEPPVKTPNPDGEGSKNNSISIDEKFDGANGAVDGEGYTWDAVIGTDWNNSNKGLSLTANKDKTILTIADGAGGPQKNINISFDAGSVKGFGQAAATWEMIFKSTDDTELFKLRFVSGGWARTLSLVSGDTVKEITNSYADGNFTASNLSISFGPNGGKVTAGSASVNFDEGSDLGSISVTYDDVKDWDRPFIIDNFKMNTVDKEKVTLKVASSEAGQSVEGAKLTIGEDVYTVPADGIVEAYYLPGTYDYSIKLAKHKAVSGTLEVAKAGATQTVYTFENIDSAVTSPTLIKAEYAAATGVLKSVTAEEVEISGGKYEVAADSDTAKYMLWDSLAGMKPLGTVKTDTVEISNDKDITLEYVGDPVPTKIEIAGGEEYIYLPADGTTTSKKFTATVYDQSDLVMDNAEVEWTLPGQPAGISVADGVITLLPTFPLTDDNGVDVSLVATAKGTQAKAEVSVHIHNTARATSWDIVGPAVIKDGTQATYTVENVKDQYNNDYKGETEFVLTSSAGDKAVIDGLKITPNTGVTRTEELTLTVALSTNALAKIDRTVTVYGYDYYEPGIGQATYGSPRMEVVNNVNSVVWPKGGETTTITLPTPVALTAGGAKMITFDNIMVTKEISAQERSLTFKNSKDEAVLTIGYAGTTVVTDYAKSEDGKSYVGTEIGPAASFGESASATFVIKTDMSGASSAILSYNGKTLKEFSLEKGTDIAKIVMTTGAGCPDERQLTLTNLIIADNDVPEVEIVGDDKLAKISGLVATKKFKGSIFSQADGETYTWSVAGKDGNAIDGVTVDQNGVLSVTDTVAPETVAVLSYTSSLSTAEAPKKATHEVTIKDFASVKSFDFVGPVAVNAGETVTYEVKNIVDEYGDKVVLPVSYAVTAGDTVATINAATGEAVSNGTLGKFTVTATVGNPGKTTTKTIEAEVAKYSAVGDASGSSVEVNVAELANYAADTKYLVTTATADGKLVKQSETAHTGGKVTVDTTGAAKYEVSPIVSLSGLSGVSSSGKVIPLCDGLYDFTFKKSNGERSDILVNNNIVGQNVDQYGLDRGPSGSYYSVKDVLVQGGSAKVTMSDNKGSDITSIVVKKAPTILTRKTHVYILGDSLVSNYYSDVDSQYSTPDNYDAQTGWGQVLHKFFTDDINVTNLAESGSSVVRKGSVGLFETAFPGVLANAKAGDYLIWEAGYNDSSYSDENSMAAALQIAADECKAAGVNLILSTPNFGPGHGSTNGANVRFGPRVLSIAEENGILGINLSGDLYAKYAADTNADKATYWSRNFHAQSSGKPDLHMSYRGAIQNACVVAQAIYNAQKDTENAELAAALQNLKINTEAQTVTDAAGATLTFQVQ